MLSPETYLRQIEHIEQHSHMVLSGDPEERAEAIRLAKLLPEIVELLREALRNVERVTNQGQNAAPGVLPWLMNARAAIAKAQADQKPI